VTTDLERSSSIVRAVGPRLRTLRTERDLTLAAVAERTGISVSTLSRLESGGRQPTLELLLDLAAAYDVSLDDLVVTAGTADPRVRRRPISRDGMTMQPLSSTRSQGGQAFRLVIPAGRRRRTPDPRTHEGYEWIYVLSGRLRLVLGDHDLVLEPGEAAEFDTQVPHWFGGADPDRVELLSIFGAQGERVHVRARSRSDARDS
jgi:transcriptional regulator with XRE-family HTH domain